MSPSWMAHSPGEAPCLPFPPACAKGRRTLSRAGQAGLRKSSWHRRCHQGVSPAGSVGAERCPPGTSAPRRGVLRASGTRPGPTGAEAKTLTKSLPPEAFSTFLRLLEANKTLGRWSHLPVRSAQGVGTGKLRPTPCKPFEKGLSENFTFLHPAYAETSAFAEGKKAACPVRPRTTHPASART